MSTIGNFNFRNFKLDDVKAITQQVVAVAKALAPVVKEEAVVIAKQAKTEGPKAAGQSLVQFGRKIVDSFK